MMVPHTLKMITALITFFALSSCKNDARSRIRIGMVASPLNGLVYLANHQGYFSKWDVDVTIVAYRTVRDVNRALYQGEIDLGCGAQTTIALNYLENRPQRIYTQLYRGPSNVRLLSLNAAKFNNGNYLKGKTIGILRGTTSEYLIHKDLMAKDIALNNIRFKNVEHEDAYELLHHSVIDAFLVDEPLATVLTQGWDDERLSSTPINVGSEIGLLYGRDHASENFDIAIDRVLRSLVQAQAHAIKHPNSLNEAVLAGLSSRLEIQLITNMLGSTILSLGLTHYLISELDETSSWMTLIRKTPELKSATLYKMFDRQTLKSIEPRLVTLF